MIEGEPNGQLESVRDRRRREIAGLLATEAGWAEVQPDVLTGPARIPRPSGGHYTFHLQIELPSHFPSSSSEPTVTVLGHDLGVELTVDDHVTDGTKLCLQVTNSGDIDYESGGLRELIDQVAIHLWRVVLRKHGGAYPGPSRAHGAEGLLEALRDRLEPALQPYADPVLAREIPGHRAKCPCNSGKRFAECCQASVRDVRHRFRRIRQWARDVRRRRPATVSVPTPR